MTEAKANNQPLVSVLITCYNAMPYLVKAVEGIINQTYNNWELVIINDHSSDNTMDYLGELISEKIIVKTNPKKGRASALNFGLSLCKGKYIAINDADDYSMSDRIEKQVRYLEENLNVGVLGGGKIIWDEKSRKYKKTVVALNDREIREFFTRGQPIQHSCVMIRKDLIDLVNGYNEKIPFLLDRDIFLRLGKLSKYHQLADVIVQVNRNDKQFFLNNYKGIEREKRSLKYRIKAIRQFNFPNYFIIREILRSCITLLPQKVIVNISNAHRKKNENK